MSKNNLHGARKMNTRHTLPLTYFLGAMLVALFAATDAFAACCSQWGGCTGITGTVSGISFSGNSCTATIAHSGPCLNQLRAPRGNCHTDCSRYWVDNIAVDCESYWTSGTEDPTVCPSGIPPYGQNGVDVGCDAGSWIWCNEPTLTCPQPDFAGGDCGDMHEDACTEVSPGVWKKHWYNDCCSGDDPCVPPCSPLKGQACGTPFCPGTYDCSGACTGQPANGGACTSPANGPFCPGKPGVIACNGVCTAPPADANGGACSTPANGPLCPGNAGVMDCNTGGCSAAPALASPIPAIACSNSNGPLCTTNGTRDCNGTCTAAPAPVTPVPAIPCSNSNGVNCTTNGNMDCNGVCSAAPAPVTPVPIIPCSKSNGPLCVTGGKMDCNNVCSAPNPPLTPVPPVPCTRSNGAFCTSSGNLACDGITCDAGPPPRKGPQCSNGYTGTNPACGMNCHLSCDDNSCRYCQSDPCVNTDPACSIPPGIPETCNGVDDDCDGAIDSGGSCASCDTGFYDPAEQKKQRSKAYINQIITP